MAKRPTLHPCPACGVRLMKHRGGKHGLAHHDCMAVTPEMRVQVHQHVVRAVMAEQLDPATARSALLKMLVMKAYEDGAGVREIAEALDKVMASGGQEGGGQGLGAWLDDDDDED